MTCLYGAKHIAFGGEPTLAWFTSFFTHYSVQMHALTTATANSYRHTQANLSIFCADESHIDILGGKLLIRTVSHIIYVINTRGACINTV